nr:UDP-3-O-[3-hydroxymyristoyl] glucosamine N-acyltransferase [Candidatus Cloacimonadota bacterium]
MKVFKQKLSSAEISAIIGGEKQEPSDILLNNVSEAQEANESSIIFCEQERLLEEVQASRAGLIITNQTFAKRLANRPIIIVDKPYFSFMSLVSYWLKLDADEQEYTIDPSAKIHPSVSFAGKVSIGANVIIKANCQIGDNVVIGENCYIDKEVSIGANSRLYPNVTIYERVHIGKECIIHSGVVIGADGFGFVLMDNRQQKIPQVGTVEIHDYVEIGANSTIDRATLGATVIGEGCKLDNLVQIGHNCVIGKHSILCAQVGLAGSTIVGDYVYLAGQVGAAGHITIGSRAMVGAQSGIAASLPEGGKYFGTPAIDANQMKRQIIAQKSLPDMYRIYRKKLKGEKCD